MKLKNIKTKEVILDFKGTPANYLVKCDSPKYATFAEFDGEEIIELNNK
jgi:hypothetical protein